MKTEFTEKQLKYLKNEIESMKLRIIQLYSYTRKFNSILHGISVGDTEKKFTPVNYKNFHKKKDIMEKDK